MEAWFVIMLLLLMLPHEASTNKHAELARMGRMTEKTSASIRLDRKDCGSIADSNLISLRLSQAYPIKIHWRGTGNVKRLSQLLLLNFVLRLRFNAVTLGKSKTYWRLHRDLDQPEPIPMPKKVMSMNSLAVDARKKSQHSWENGRRVGWEMN